MRTALLTGLLLAALAAPATAAAETTLGDCGEGAFARLLATGAGGPAVWLCERAQEPLGLWARALRGGAPAVRLADDGTEATVAGDARGALIAYRAGPGIGDRWLVPVDATARPVSAPVAFPAHHPGAEVWALGLARVRGGVLAAWAELPPTTPEHREDPVAEVATRLMAPDGRPAGPVHVLARARGGAPASPIREGASVTVTAGGIVTWTRRDGSLFARPISAAGVPRGRGRRVLTGAALDTAVAPTAHGYVVASLRQAALAGRDIVARALDRRGAPRGPVRQVVVRGSDTYYSVKSLVRSRAGVALLVDQRWDVPTSSSATYGGQDQILVGRLDADARTLTAPRRVSGPPSPARHATDGLLAAESRTLLWVESARVVEAPWGGGATRR